MEWATRKTHFAPGIGPKRGLKATAHEASDFEWHALAWHSKPESEQRR